MMDSHTSVGLSSQKMLSVLEHKRHCPQNAQNSEEVDAENHYSLADAESILISPFYGSEWLSPTASFAGDLTVSLRSRRNSRHRTERAESGFNGLSVARNIIICKISLRIPTG